MNYVGKADAALGVVQDLIAAGGQAMAIQADVSREDEVTEMFAKAVRAFGTIDVLVNNAGIQADAPFTEMSLDQWTRVLAVNLTGMFLCAREAAREMIRRGPRPESCRARSARSCASRRSTR